MMVWCTDYGKEAVYFSEGLLILNRGDVELMGEEDRLVENPRKSGSMAIELWGWKLEKVIYWNIIAERVDRPWFGSASLVMAKLGGGNG